MQNQQQPRPIEILLVEDNPGDVRLTQEALKEARVLYKLHVVEDGIEALAFLQRKGQYTNCPLPDIVLLDLNLPRKHGHEVLQELKKNRRLKHIPVVVLTTSAADDDILQSYNLHANAYIIKPVDLEKFLRVMKTFEDFWLLIAQLPHIDKP